MNHCIVDGNNVQPITIDEPDCKIEHHIFMYSIIIDDHVCLDVISTI
jgi:hypothetical protein